VLEETQDLIALSASLLKVHPARSHTLRTQLPLAFLQARATDSVSVAKLQPMCEQMVLTQSPLPPP